MAFTEKISLLFDVDSSNGVRSLKDLRASVHDADGVMGKFKAGVGGAAGVLKENLGAAALAAGAALVTFGIKAVHAFEDAAKSAINLSAATGLSTEEASRWIAVADDAEVSAGALQAGLGKIAKNLDGAAWEKYGIATRDAGGHARGTNDILLDAFDALGEITNETARAKAGNDLFGKGYAELAPLIGQSRAEYEKMLGTVSDGQVITSKEAEKAERMRLAEDALKDALQEVTLAVGEFVAELAPVIEFLAGAITKTLEFSHALRDLTFDLVGVSGEVMELGPAFEKAGKNVRLLSKDVRDDADAMGDAARATSDMKRRYEELTGALDNREAWLNLLDDIDAYKAKMADGTTTAREAEQANIDIRQSLINYTASLENLPAKKETEILSLIDMGEYDRVKTMLDQLAAPRAVRYTSSGDAIGVSGRRASGGPVSAGGSYLVGEKGPEIVTMGANGYVTPNDRLGGGTTNVYITTGADPRQVIEVVRRAQRTGQL